MTDGYEFYWHLLDALEEGIYFANEKRKITYWNKAAANLTGFKSGEVLGKSCRDDILNHTDLSGEPLCNDKCPIHNAMDQGIQIQQEALFTRKDGKKIPVKIKTLPVRDKSGKIMGAVEIFTPQIR